MGFADQVRQMFSGGQQQQSQQHAVGNVPGQKDQVQQGTGNTPTVQQNPMDAYADLFKPQDPSKKQADPPAFQLDPALIEKAAGSIDFTSKLPPELRARFQGEDGEALMAVMNLMGRQAYQASISHMSALTDKFVGLRSNFDQQNLGDNVKSHLVQNTLQSKFANTNPVTKQGLQMISGMMKEAFPDATPEWISEQAPKFFVEMAKQLAPEEFNASKQQNPQNSTEVDWGNWLLSGQNANQS
jgi:hypothetical protein